MCIKLEYYFGLDKTDKQITDKYKYDYVENPAPPVLIPSAIIYVPEVDGSDTGNGRMSDGSYVNKPTGSVLPISTEKNAIADDITDDVESNNIKISVVR